MVKDTSHQMVVKHQCLEKWGKLAIQLVSVVITLSHCAVESAFTRRNNEHAPFAVCCPSHATTASWCMFLWLHDALHQSFHKIMNHCLVVGQGSGCKNLISHWRVTVSVPFIHGVPRLIFQVKAFEKFWVRLAPSLVRSLFGPTRLAVRCEIRASGAGSGRDF